MRFALTANDRRVRELVVAVFQDDDSLAATWRAVGEAAERLEFARPSYELVHKLAGHERRRREGQQAARRARLDVATAFFLSTRVVDTPIALDRLALAKRDEQLVTQWHEPASGDER